MQEKIRVLVDMDGVIVDLEKAADQWMEKHPYLDGMFNGKNSRIDLIPGIFRDPPFIDGAKEALNELHNSGKFELVIATAAPWDSDGSETDKKHFIKKHFNHIFRKNMVITHRKDLIKADWIIDDNTFNGVAESDANHIHFGTDAFPDWKTVVSFLMKL